MRHFDVQLIGGDRPPPGQDRRDEDRRGQDARPDPGRRPQRARRPRRPRRHRQRLPRPARRAVDGPGLPLPRRCRVGIITHDTSLPVRARLPDHRRAADQPAAGARGARPTRPTSPTARTTSSASTTCATTWSRARPAGPARAQLRDRRRGGQHPHRRGADAADHQRPGRGVGGPVLHVRPPRAAAAADARKATRRAATTSSTSRTRAVSPTEDGHRQDGEAGSASPTSTTPDPRLARHFEPALKAHALYKRDRDYIVKDGEIVIVDEFTGRLMPGRRW